jgi:2-polyprenyl-3-methyl-5-hydroxy-6-metoxy-1,4-benzoquinol methylase
MSSTFSLPEKQLITTLAWFRSRYALFMGLTLERKADRTSIEEFGKVWIGSKKQNWEEAFESLVQKNIITSVEGEYRFTESGEAVKNEVEAETPFYKYEYDNYFNLDHGSKAHSVFCEKVYGMDLSQHGLIDQGELQVLLDKLNVQKPASVLDIGCGNGRITEWIASQTQATCTGVDISSEAVRLANERVRGNSKLHFTEGNLNHLNILEHYDCILFLDTLYYADNLAETIKQAAQLLNPHGKIYAYFSQWIMDENYHENLLPENTHLAKALRELNLHYTTTDLTVSGINHWKKKCNTLIEMKNEFLSEGSEALWDYRFREANRYANWGDKKYSRYLYEISKA